MAATESRRVLPLSLLAVGAAALLIGGCGSGSSGYQQAEKIGDDDVATVLEVKDGAIGQADYDEAIEQAKARFGIEELPAADSPEFTQINNETMQGLLLSRWVEGEAVDRGLELEEADIEAELDRIQMGFPSERAFARVVREQGFCSDQELEEDVAPADCAEVRDQARQLALQRLLQAQPDFSGNQEEAAQAQEDFVGKWTERTLCTETVKMQFCRGFEPPEVPPLPGGTPVPPGTEGGPPPGAGQAPPPGTGQTPPG